MLKLLFKYLNERFEGLEFAELLIFFVINKQNLFIFISKNFFLIALNKSTHWPIYVRLLKLHPMQKLHLIHVAIYFFIFSAPSFATEITLIG